MSYNQAVRQISPQTQPDLVASSGLSTPLLLSALGRDAGLIGVALLTAERLEQELLLQA